MLRQLLQGANALKLANGLATRHLVRGQNRPNPVWLPCRPLGSILSDGDLFAEDPVAPTLSTQNFAKEGSVVESASHAFFGESVPFEKLGLRQTLVASLSAEGKVHSTAIQARSMEPLLAGDDVVIGAETGSGKTLAYILPLFERLLRTSESKEASAAAAAAAAAAVSTQDVVGEEGEGDSDDADDDVVAQRPASLESYPRALVLAPNRELVQQILTMAGPSASACGLKLGAGARAGASSGSVWPYVLGGRREAPDVLVCTPAFAAQHSRIQSSTGVALFRHLEALVLDEADMLLDGGFLNAIDDVLLARTRAHRTALGEAKAAALGEGNTLDGSGDPLVKKLTWKERKRVKESMATGKRVGDDDLFRSDGDEGNEEGADGAVESSEEKEERWRASFDTMVQGVRACQVVLAAATIPNYGLKSVEEAVRKRFPGAVRVENPLLHRTHDQLQQQWIEVGDNDGYPKPIDALVKMLTDEDDSDGVEDSGGSGGGEESPFSSLTVAELKDLLRAASLSQQGKKAELVSRLLAHGSSGGDGPSTTATPTQIQRQEERTMVFCNTAASAAKVCDALNERGVASLPYHKEVSAEEREANLNAFAAASNSLASLAGTTDIELGDDSGALTSVPRVLVCTDLAARGLDVQGPSALVDPQGQGNKMGVDHVVQFEFALNVVQHLHRLGRTARAGQPGKATHLVQPAGSAGAALADHVRRATEEGLPLEESFSRKRGFRKKIKKTGQPFNSKASQQRGSGRG